MVKRYAHLAPEHLRAAAAALDGVLAVLEPDSKETASETVEVRRCRVSWWAVGDSNPGPAD